MEVTKELILKYHLNQCSAEERAAVEAWLAADEAQMSFPEDFDLDYNQNKGWDKISERYNLAGAEEDIKHKKAKKLLIKRILLPVAACLGFVLMFGLGYIWLRSEKQESIQLSYQTVEAKKGEKRSVILEDGTKVWLNSHSSITFPKVFSGKNRTVKLTGEAYFMVAKNRLKPFIVNSPRTVTRVLGTHFNLRDYSDEPKSLLVVEEGKVSFKGIKTAGELILTANQKGVLDNSKKRIFTENIYSGIKYSEWRENRLFLDDLTLEEIKPLLERWYNVKVVISQKALAKERYKGSFTNPSIDEVLSSICIATRTSYLRQNKTFIIGK